MGADKLDPVGNLPLQRFPCARFDIFMAEQRLTLRPAFNPFKQRAGLVPVWLARRLRGIQVNMRLNKWWNGKSAAGIQDLIAFAVGLVHGRDSTKPTVLDGDLPQPFAIR